MADSSDPCLFTKRAQRGTGSSAVDGVCMISKAKVRWQPNDPSKGQPALIDITAITSEWGRHSAASPPVLLCLLGIVYPIANEASCQHSRAKLLRNTKCGTEHTSTPPASSDDLCCACRPRQRWHLFAMTLCATSRPPQPLVLLACCRSLAPPLICFRDAAGAGQAVHQA